MKGNGVLPIYDYARFMQIQVLKHTFCFFVAMMFLAGCAPARNLDAFVERKPNPVLDQGAHNSPVEWWYLNGHLQTASGKTKTFAFAIFQVLIPNETSYFLANVFPGPLFFGHFSLGSPSDNTFLYTERSTFPNPRTRTGQFSGSASRKVLDISLGDWKIVRDKNGDYNIRAGLEKKSLSLNLHPTRPEIVHGPGWSGSTVTGRMYYYSATRLSVSGTLDNEAVSGLAWFDHQWGGGVGLSGDASASFAPHWNWFSLQLNDGRDLMVYQIKNAKGEIEDAFVSQTNGNGESTTSRNFKLQPYKYWKNSEGVAYPVAWTLKLEDGTFMTMRALMENQEVRAYKTSGFPYYEGAVELLGGVGGIGFAELTGYAPAKASPFSNPFAFGAQK